MNQDQEYRKEKRIYGAFVAFIGLLIIAISIWGCSPRVTEHTIIEYRDSTVYKETVKDTTIFVPLPLEKDQAIVHVGDTSSLKTSLAESVAFIGKDGFLHHSLENRKGTLPVVVPIKSIEIYSGVVNNKAEILTKTIEVEKPLSWWQKFQIGAFWWLLGAVVLLLLWTFRKPILKLLKI